MSSQPEQSSPTRPCNPAKGPARDARPRLAVLPFQDRRRESPQDHLAEGLAAEVLKALGHVQGLRTVSRTTSFPIAGRKLPLAELGRRLQATVILRGQLKDQEDQLLLEPELVDVATGRTLWSQPQTFPRQDLFAAILSLSNGVASALRLSVPTGATTEVDTATFECFLRGRHNYFRYSRDGMAQATTLYRQALALDPNYARAWAGLAECAAYTYIYIERSEAQRELAEGCSRKALALDPNLAEAQASRGVALSAAGRAAEAEEAFETALRLDPNLYEAAYFYARHCFAVGKPERAIEYFEWASALRPEDFQAILLVAQVYHSLGVEDEAELARRRGLALVEERLAQAPDDVRARYLGANALVALGEREKGLEWARLARSMDPEDPMLLYNLGCIYALAGNPDEALDCLQQAILKGLTQKNWFQHDGDLDSVRSLPRFQEMLDLLQD